MDFNDVIGKAKDGFEAVAKKTEEVVNVSKLKIEQSSVEAKLKADFERLGKLCYYSMQDGEEKNEAAYKSVMEDISSKLEQIEALKTEIENMKDKKLCPGCHRYVNTNSAFCSFCGGKMN